MDVSKQDRRFNRSKTKHESLTNLLDYAKIYGGFEHAVIIHHGEIVARSTHTDQAVRMRDIALILQKSASYLSKASSLPDIETIVAQTSRGDSIACFFFKATNGSACAIVALSKTRIPHPPTKSLRERPAGMSESYEQRRTEVHLSCHVPNTRPCC